MNTGFLCVFKGKIQVKEPVLWHFLRSEVLYSKKDFEGAIKFVISRQVRIKIYNHCYSFDTLVFTYKVFNNIYGSRVLSFAEKNGVGIT